MTWKFITVGLNHTLALNYNDILYSWGGNDRGQLGDGSSIDRSTPGKVLGAPSTWKTISPGGGGAFCVGIAYDNTLWAWGYNGVGCLGDGTSIDRWSPVKIGTSTWNAIAAGNNHALGLLSSNTLFGWGYNAYGNIGDNTTVVKYSPTSVAGASTWKAIACGYDHSLGILSDDKLFGWGRDHVGQVGDATTVTSRVVPTAVGSSTWKFVGNTDGNYSLGIKYDNTLWSWGDNSYGQLGDGTSVTKTSPTQIFYASSTYVWKIIDSFGEYVLALNDDDILYSWGYNGSGQLGNGTTANTNPIPTSLVAPFNTSTWKSVVACYNNTLALNYSNILYIWGNNDYGGLGNGSTNAPAYNPTPGLLVAPFNTSTWKSVVNNGNGHALALNNSDILYGWGFNYYGQLGTGITVWSNPTPTLLVAPFNTSTWRFVTSGYEFTSALNYSNILYSWGRNLTGALGNGTTAEYSATPTLLVAPFNTSTWKSVVCCMEYTLALNYNNILYSWGRNNYGQLGNGTTAITNSTPTLLVAPFNTSTWKSIIGGGYHTLALNYNDILYSWGFNYYGQLGNGTTATYNSTPSLLVAPFNTSTWRFVASGYDCVFAINYSNILYVWGNNAYGRLGDSSTATYSPIPITISTTSTMTRIMKSKSAFGVDNTTGTAHIDGTLFAWGNNNFDFTNTSTWIPSPIQVNKPTWKVTWKTLSNCAGGGSTGPSQLAIDTDGKMWAWGVNDLCQLGTGSNYVATTFILSPMLINASVTWKAVANGNPFSLALDSNGYLYATGFNGYGQFGNGVTASFYVHTKIGTSTWNSIYASMYYSSGILSDNTLWAWGYNNKGQLGDGSITDKKSPTQVLISQSTWKMVDIGEAHALAIAGDNTLWAWGRNYSGQLGDGTTVDKTTPVMIGSSTWKIVSAATGGNADMGWSLAIRGDNTLWAWGNNFYGSLGDGGTTNRPAPVQIGASTWTAVSAGGAHALAILGSNNTLWAWGNNSQGQVGDGGTTNRPAPVQVGTSTWIVISAGGLGAFGDAHPQTGIGIPCCKTMLQLKNGGSVTCAFANELTNSRTIRMERILKEILIVYLV